MEQQLVAKQRQVAQLCAQYGVARLWVFGSAASGDFNPETSDYDFLFDWLPTVERPGRAYLDFRRNLMGLLGREVDLVEDKSIKNPYFAYAARSSAVPIYG
jgi:predicted nucleotidyltransferase